MAPNNTLKYEVVEGWEQLPKGYAHRDVAGVAVDLEDRVFIICRGDHPIIMYDGNGKFLGSWGEGDFTYRTHGITVGPDNSLFCTDDGNHTIRKFTPDGKLLFTMGTMNTPSDTGYDGKDTKTVSRPGGPSTVRPTSRSRRAATSTSPTGTATAGCTSSRLVASSSARGACRARVPASSCFRTGSRWPPTDASSCAIARTTGSRSSPPTAST